MLVIKMNHMIKDKYCISIDNYFNCKIILPVDGRILNDIL